MKRDKTMPSSRELVQLGLLEKYDCDLYAMYVEYPHKSFWTETRGDELYRAALRELLPAGSGKPLLLYVHIPFCPRLCHFCSCHTRATSDYGKITEYLELLHREIDLLADFLKEEGLVPDFREIHLGGGSPTMLENSDFVALLAKLRGIVDFSGLSEIAMEIDPRHVSREQLLFYAGQGVNRISFGVQDLNPEVQQAVGRIQPAELIEGLLTPEVRRSFTSINFDIMWGLPRQTRASFGQTIDRVLAFDPDRISLLLLHYAPNVKKNQILMKPEDFPGDTERTELFLDAVEKLVANGYCRIGFDHFAKQDDAVSVALRERKITWNSLGYTPGRYQDVLGIGTGSSSRLTETRYFQNVYDQERYRALLEQGKFPLLRSYQLERDDVIRRDVLHTLRSHLRLSFPEIETRHDIVFRDYFAAELDRLPPFIEDGLVEIDADSLRLTEGGSLFTTLICRTFDRYAKIDQCGIRPAA